ncbi:hypothetical protein [Candidatus Contubernalis alkaliaceticus]|uniref:hypothetical protein n=1 Tax=Candidatus Contubernalis alkaliaceticus TaxID=338645 RepID=UPI001F4C1E54|nr:hypothetical protein [Candidatus Contubernalis alkalaceticus]UNC91040.1 hypothetical protein HUE98_02440 [Candidatus Contubernalis alkalaceticus]
MPDKRTICSVADSLVFDYIPKKIGNIIDKNIKISEDIRAAVVGMNDETLLVTDKGAYIIKKGKCNFFSYDEMLVGRNVSRVYRRGRFEIPLKGKGKVRLPDESKEPDFGPDPAPNVVNFPWSKADLFTKAKEILSVHKELHDTRTGAPHISIIEDKDYVSELMSEIRKLNEQLANLKELKK